MSISNIFECCKKTEILMGLSGIVLGTYATNAFLKSPIIGIPVNTIEVINLPPIDTSQETDNKTAPLLSTKIVQPIASNENLEGIRPINMRLDPPISYFTAFMNSTRVLISGALAYITIGNGIIIAISAAAYFKIANLLNSILRRRTIIRNYGNRLGEGSYIGKKLKTSLNTSKYGNINKDIPITSEEDLKRKPLTDQQKAKINRRGLQRFMHKTADDFRNKKKKATIRQGKGQDPKDPNPFFDFEGKRGGTIYFFDEPKIGGKIGEPEKIIIENKSDENIDESIKNLEEDEKKLEEEVNQTVVYTEMQLYKEYIEILTKEMEENKIEVDVKELDDNFNHFGVPPRANFETQFNLNIRFNNENTFERLYNVSYNDLNNFLKFGNAYLAGDIKITEVDYDLDIDTFGLEIITKEKLEITYENLPFLLFLNLKTKQKSYINKIIDFYTKIVLPLIAALKNVGISRSSDELFDLFGEIFSIDIIELMKKNKVLNIKVTEEERNELLIKRLENKVFFIRPTQDIIDQLKIKDNYDYDINISLFRNLIRIPRFRKIYIEIENNIYVLFSRALSMRAIIDIIRNVYITLHSK